MVVIAAILVPSCRKSGGSESAPPGPVVVPAFLAPVQSGTVASADVVEASGLAAARKTVGVLFSHNDSGDGPYVYAMTSAGAHLAKYQLTGATANDWEDMAIGPGPSVGETYLYIGDIGANVPVSNVTVYRVVEPVVAAAPGITALGGVDAIPMTYPDGPHNAECLLSDPVSGDLFIVTKEGSGQSKVFRAPAPHAAGVNIVLLDVGTIDVGAFSSSVLVTGGDVSPAGDLIALRTYTGVYLWPRQPGAALAGSFASAPVACPAAAEGQGETVAFAADGGGYYTVSEGAGQPIWFCARVP